MHIDQGLYSLCNSASGALHLAAAEHGLAALVGMFTVLQWRPQNMPMLGAYSGTSDKSEEPLPSSGSGSCELLFCPQLFMIANTSL